LRIQKAFNLQAKAENGKGIPMRQFIHLLLLSTLWLSLPHPGLAAATVSDPGLAIGKPVTASSEWGRGFEAAKACDGNAGTRWGAGKEARNGWLVIDLQKETVIGHAMIAEAEFPRTEEFVIEGQVGETWKELQRGTVIAGWQLYHFPPVAVRRVRLSILKASDVPTLEEFQVYAPDAKLPVPPVSVAAKPEAMKAWQDMRFGMFICWGPVTLTNREIGWSRGAPTPIVEYDALYKKWNPEKFDAREWVKVAKETGCKYIVFLTKHHDGFCLFDTKQTDYNIMNGPFKRDITKEIADACHAAGIGFFPYYSTCDWHHPDFPVTSPHGNVKRAESNLDRYTEYLEAQTQELITQYGPLTGIWFDVPQCFDRARGERVIRHVRKLQPDILVNNRTGAPGDFDTPEQNVGGFNGKRPWESCITLGTQWTWKPDDKLKSYTEAIRMLAVCAVNNGNLALNTNPMPDGRIEPRQVEAFQKIGEWLGNYGEAIYGTRGGPLVAPDWKKRSFNTDREHFSLPQGNWWGGSTHKGKIIYLHILRWPAETIALPAIRQKIVKHTVLTGGTATVKQTDAGIEVSIPVANRNAIDTIVKLELDTPVEEPLP
jgi:alpha-L-fucosidase